MGRTHDILSPAELLAMTRFKSFLSITLFALSGAVACLAQDVGDSHAGDQKGSLKRFLQSYVGSTNEETKATRYSYAFVDLRDDGPQEAIVYLTSDGWCGTGGCTMLVLTPSGSSYKVVAHIPTVRLPIWVLTTKLNGWHAIRISREVPVLTYNGKRYQSDPSVSSKLKGKVQEQVVIESTTAEESLY